MLSTLAVCFLLAASAPTPCDTPNSLMTTDERQWKRVEHQDGVVVYTPPDGSGRSMRLEYLLPSGAVLVEDRDAGLAVRVEMRERVEWSSFTPSGAELHEEEVQRRAAAGECFVVLRYQDCVKPNGDVTQSVLRSVEEYAGRGLIRQAELTIEVHPPQHLAGTYLIVPDEKR